MEARPWKGNLPAAMDLARASSITLGPVRVEPALRQVSANGRAETLEPRTMRVLVALAGAEGGVLTRDDLLELCWDGQIVSDNAINRVISQLRRMFERLSGDRVRVETITKVGFRLVAEQRSEAPPRLIAGVPTAADASGTDTPRLSRRAALAGAAAVLAGAAGFAAWRLRGPATDPRVAALIERGHAALRDELPDSTQQGIGFFQEALRLDPRNALGWGLLALAYRNVAEWADAPDIPASVEACQQAARRALEIEPDQAEASVALATLPPIYGDWIAGEQRISAVLARHPEQLDGMAALGLLMFSVGRAREAAELTGRLVELDPLSPIHLYRRSYHLWTLGRLAEADQAIDRGMQLWPSHPAIEYARFLIFAGSDRPEAALRIMDAARNPSPSTMEKAWRLALGAMISKANGDIAAAITACMAAARESGSGCVNAILALNRLGAIDEAFVVAEGYLLRRGPLITDIGRLGGTVVNNQRWRKTMMIFTAATAPMRADPRFARLCEDIGLARYWRETSSTPYHLERARRVT